MEEKLSEEGGSTPTFLLTLPNPTPSFSKTFVFIESLFAVFPFILRRYDSRFTGFLKQGTTGGIGVKEERFRVRRKPDAEPFSFALRGSGGHHAPQPPEALPFISLRGGRGGR